MIFSRIREPRDLARILLGRPSRAEQEELRRLQLERKRHQRERAAAARVAAMPRLAEPIFAIDNIELTNRCPMRCVMCPRTHHMTRDQGYMSFDVFKRVIDEFIAVNPETARTKGAFLHHFGESLMHPKIDRFIRYAEESGVRVKLSVNPLAMKDQVIKRLIEAPPSYLMVALDGHDNESFERIRGVRDAYDFSVERLHKYLEQKIAAEVPTFVELGMIDFAENEDSLHLLRDRWAKVDGIDSVRAKQFTAWDGSAEEINAYSPPPDHQRRGAQDISCARLPAPVGNALDHLGWRRGAVLLRLQSQSRARQHRAANAHRDLERGTDAGAAGRVPRQQGGKPALPSMSETVSRGQALAARSGRDHGWPADAQQGRTRRPDRLTAKKTLR